MLLLNVKTDVAARQTTERQNNALCHFLVITFWAHEVTIQYNFRKQN